MSWRLTSALERKRANAAESETSRLRAQVSSQAREIERLEAERDAYRRSFLSAEKDCTRALRKVERIEGRLARVLNGLQTGSVEDWIGNPCGPGVWSRRRSGANPGRPAPGTPPRR
jgi:chromosome segregation ATPase